MTTTRPSVQALAEESGRARFWRREQGPGRRSEWSRPGATAGLALGTILVALGTPPPVSANAIHVKLRTPVPDDAAALAFASAIAREASIGPSASEKAPMRTASIDPTSARRLFRRGPCSPHAELAREIGLDRWITVRIRTGADVPDALRSWNMHSGVEVAEAVRPSIPLLVPDDPLFQQQWQHENTGSNPGIPGATADADLDTAEAWDTVLGQSRITNLERVSWFHADLVNRVWQNLGEDRDGDGVLEWSPGSGRWVLDPDDLDGVDDDGNGYVDDLVGWNFGEDDPYPETGATGHGTATAGLLLAEPMNGIGIAGTCHDCRLIAVAGDIPGGIVYAVDRGARVLSLSLVEASSQAFDDALAYATALGAVLVTGAGNTGGLDVNPICAHPEVMCVGASDPSDGVVTLASTGGAWGSSYGGTVDVAAPGIHLTYLLPGASGWAGSGSGTSFSTPLAAGTVALVQSANPTLSPREIISLAQSSTDPFVSADRFAGTGRVNALAAIERAATAAAVGSFPVALFDGFATGIDLWGGLEVHGIAESPAFASGRIRVGLGLEPSTWLLDEPLVAPVPGGLLASASVADHPRGTDFHFELEVTDTHGQTAIDRFHPLVQTNSFPEKPAWPLVDALDFERPVAFDLDGDGAAEIVVEKNGELFAYSGGGTALPGWPLTGLVNRPAPPAFVDVDGAAGAEILFAHQDPGGEHRLHARRADGSSAPGWPQDLAARPYHYALVGDVDGDGTPEIVQAAWFPLPTPTIHVFRTDGSALFGWPLSLPATMIGAPVLADLDGDGNVEILLRANASIQAYDGDASPVAGWSLDDFATFPLTAGDVDGDGTDEVVRIRNDEIWLHSSDGSALPGWPHFLPDSLETVVLGDLDGDRIPEIVVETTDHDFTAWRADGSLLPGWPSFVFQGRLVALADVDGDGRLELVARTPEGTVAIDGDGTAHPAWPLVPGDRIEDALVADVDPDPQLELVIAATRVDAGNAIGTLHVFDLGRSARRPSDWTLPHGDGTNSRRVPAGTGAVPAPLASITSGVSLLPLRPNPSPGVVTIPFALGARARVALDLFDVAGRRVRTLLRTELAPGAHAVAWDVRDDRGVPVGSGVFFARLETGGQVRVQRVVALRP